MQEVKEHIATTQLVPQLRFKEFDGAWEEKNLSDIAEFHKGKGISKADISEDGVLECIRYGELYTTYTELIQDIVSKTNLPAKDLILSEFNDVIIPASGESNIDIATAACVLKSGVAFSGDLNIIRSKMNGIFLSFYLNNKRKFDIARLAQGVSVVHLYSSQLKTLKLNIPSLPEQQKIASFLSAVDEKIQQLTKKKALLEQYKKGGLQQLFSGQLRFKDENGNPYPDWEEKRLGLEVTEYKEKSKVNDEYEVLTSSNKGLMLQSEYYGENRLTERDNLGFNIVPENHITFRSRSDNRKFTFNLNNLGLTGVISTYYPVFKSTNGSSFFIVEMLNYNQNFIGKYSVGTSQTVLSMNELKRIKFKFPCSEEQQKIATYLSRIDTKIESVNNQITQTQTFKKGLLQQMFV